MNPRPLLKLRHSLAGGQAIAFGGRPASTLSEVLAGAVRAFELGLVAFALAVLCAAPEIAAAFSVGLGAAPAALGPASVLDPTCAAAPGDSAERASRIAEGSSYLKGLCVNTGRYRPVVGLEVDSRARVVRFQNYYYNQSFWRAEIPLQSGSISDVYFHVKKFLAARHIQAAHVQTRYKMAPGFSIRLVNQASGARAEVDDLLVSFDAALANDLNFNVALALLPTNPLVGRVGRTESILADSPRPIEQYQLALDDREKQQLLFNSLKRSQDIGLGTFYGALRPNCATEQFDLLDSLERFKGKNERFMVTASIDPVAGPSVAALRERRLILRRVENFEDEIKGRHASLPLPDETQVLPSILPEFMPNVQGAPWSMVVVAPNPATLSEQDRAAFGEFKKELLKYSLEKLSSQGVMRNFYDESAKLGVNPEKLLKTFETLKSDLGSAIARFSNQISDEDHLIAVYFGPVSGSYRAMSLVDQGIEANIPFPLINVEYDARKYAVKAGGKARSERETEAAGREVFDNIYEGAVQTARKGMEAPAPGYLLAMALQLHARRSQSTLTLQSMIGLNPVRSPLEKTNKQVTVRELEVARRRSGFEAPVAVVSSVVPIPMVESYYPRVRIDFGPIGRITDLSEARRPKGILQVWSPEPGTPEARGQSRQSLCEWRADSTPTLSGTLAAQASGYGMVDSFLAGRPVNFKILSAEVDLITATVEAIDVRADIPPLKCLALEQVNEQFIKQTNHDIVGLKHKMFNSDFAIGLIKRVMGR